MRILIKDGLVVDPSSKISKKLDIVIRNNKIEKLSSNINHKEYSFDEIIDAKNLVVAPGFVDIHVHLRDPGYTHKETIATGSKAAVAGGFTSIACMPNTKPINDNASITDYILNEAKRISMLNIFPIGAITKSSKSRELASIKSNIL